MAAANLDTFIHPDDSLDSNDFCIVGIGVSPGGLEALERFFDRMPETTGMAFVVIQHLSLDLNGLLARWTPIPIHNVEQSMPVEPNAIYLIPPNKEMVIANGSLHPTDRDSLADLALPIDHFFRSLAQDCGHRAIAIVFSGSGGDVSRGVTDVHQAGGLVMAQREDTAKFDSMPRSAIETGVVDHVVVPDEMPDLLACYANHANVDDELESAALERTRYGAVFRSLRNHFGIDFSHYQPSTILRRTVRRLILNQIGSLDDYLRQLADDPAELNALYEDLLIGVTEFFRDDEAFERLGTSAINEILRQAKPNSEIRFWNAGCATGEEAYSIAILAHERMEQMNLSLEVKVFATDVHRASLELASNGVYSGTSVTNVDPSRRARYFVEHAGRYQISPEIRRMVVFAPHNLMQDAPFTKLDLITCRNLLIYLRPLAQQKALSLLNFGLKPHGILFLGRSEDCRGLSDEFDVIDHHWKIFRKCRGNRLPPGMHLPLSVGSVPRPRPSGISRAVIPGAKPPDLSLLRIYDSLLDEFMPPAFLVNQQCELLHIFAGAGNFLKDRDGRPSPDFVDRLGAELRMAINGAFQRARYRDEPVTYNGVRVHTADGQKFFRVTVKPFDHKGDGGPYFLVLLKLVDEVSECQESDPNFDMSCVSCEQVLALDGELQYAKKNLQVTIEELEASNEQLRGTNEELVVSNEELQSTNEELHTVNEQLHRVNAEHQREISGLTELSRDMNNLLMSTDVPTLFLDHEMCIRKFTPKIGQTFNLLPHDIGRQISSFTHNIVREDFLGDIRRVLETGEPFEGEVQDRVGNWFLLRILPYYSGTCIAGVVLTLIEISGLKQASNALQESLRRRDQFLAMLSHELRNPIGAVLNAIETLCKSGSKLDEEHQVIQRQTRHMARLLDDLLDVARIHQNKIQFRKEPIDLVSLSQEVIEGVQHQFQSKDQILHLIMCNQPVAVDGDPSRLKQAQVNLLNNASKYTPPGNDVWYEIQKDDHEAMITVRDSGEGIPAELLDSIFDLFVQSDTTLDRAAGGMGVGLSLTKGIVEGHGGSLVAESQGTGTGSTFRICLPLTTKRWKPKVPAPHFSFDGRKLLLVEDNDDARTMLAKSLRLSGFEVVDARDARSVLELCETFRPDVAIVDIGLPEMDGYELARQIREMDEASDMMLIALTGYGRDEDRRAAFEAGFHAHLVKPLVPTELDELLAARFAST